jgi:predicted Zn-dependent peptidase
MKNSLTTLPNGLRVIRVPSSVSFLYLEFDVLLGFLNETPVQQKTGLTTMEFCHCNEHMAAKYTSSANQDAAKVSETLDSKGISSNAFTTLDHTGYFMQGHSDCATTMVNIFGNSFAHPHYDTKIFESEMQAVTNELSNISSDNWYMFKLARRIAMYGGGLNPLAVPETSKIENVVKLRAMGAHGMKVLMDWRMACYKPEICCVFVVGRIPQDEFSKLCTLMGAVKASGPIPKAYTHPMPSRSIEAVPQQMPKTDIHALTLNFPLDVGVFDFRSKAQISCVCSILAEGLGSRLYRELRTRLGAVYSVNAEWADSCGNLPSYLVIETKFTARKHKNETIGTTMDLIKKQTLGVLQSLAYSGPTADEMTEWKKRCKLASLYIPGPREEVLLPSLLLGALQFSKEQLLFRGLRPDLCSRDCTPPEALMTMTSYNRIQMNVKKQDVRKMAGVFKQNVCITVHTIVSKIATQ